MSNVPVVSDKTPIAPVPVDAPQMDYTHRGGKPSQVWTYLNAQGEVLMCTARFEDANDQGEMVKTVLPVTYCDLGSGRRGWRSKMLPDPRPLYGLDKLAARAEAPVLVCEGEKTADAAATMFQEYVVVTSSGGASSAHKSDWTPLTGRHVWIWPDADEAGRQYALKVARLSLEKGVASVAVVSVPASFPAAWDLADTPPDGFESEALRKLLESADPVTASNLPADTSGPFGTLKIVASTRDANSNAWGKLLQWQDPDGLTHEWAMPLSLLAGDGSEVRARLLDGGLPVAPGRKEREQLAEFLQTDRVKARARSVSRIGWHDTSAGPVFVISDEAFGNSAGERVILQTASQSENKFRSSGSLADWKAEIADRCTGNTRLLFAVSVALAAPLLHPTDGESGGYNLRGPSSIGKSTALHVAGSVWGGGGTKGYPMSWRATDNGLEAVAATHCDLLLCLDELSQVDPRSAGEAAYMLSNGIGKRRAGRTGESRSVATWRLLFLSTGEISLTDKIHEDGRKRATAGQEIRVLDLLADAGKGLGLFEDLHGEKDGADFADKLIELTRRYYGTPGREFLRLLNEDATERGNWVAFVKQTRSDFSRKYVPVGADGQVARAASRFGLVAAAGELVIEMGIAPWPRGCATKAAATCFEGWLDVRGGQEPAEVRDGIATVRAFIEAHGSSRFEEWNDVEKKTNNRAGFRKKGPDDRYEYFILPGAWSDEVCRGRDASNLARILSERGMLKAGSGKRFSRSLKVPGCGKIRVYHVLATILADEETSDAAGPVEVAEGVIG